MNEIIIGIDLGTTNSLVAHMDERGPRIIEGPGGERILPSVVYVDPVTGAPTVGKSAREHAVERPTETVFSVKRLMGKGMEDVKSELAYLPYRVVAHSDSNQMVDVEIAGRRHTPQQISAMILAELKSWAEKHFGREVKKAVITVPAYFDDAQRQATRDAGMIAGLEVVRIVNEPTAAALAYGLDRVNEGTVAVYDLGGGTFDISVFEELRKPVARVLSTNGDTHLGGEDDFDREIIALVQKEISAQSRWEGYVPPSTQQALRNFAEAVKIELSSKSQATIEIDLGGGRTYRRAITKDEFLAMIDAASSALLAGSMRCIALRDAGVTPKDIDRVIMVGGSTYMPHVQQRVGKFFDGQVYTALNPMEVVALGAAVQAGILAGISREMVLLDIIPLSLGIETLGGAMAKLISKGTHIPASAREIFSTSVDGQTNVKIHVLQGERELVKDCRSLGEFILAGIPPMPAGLPKIRVTFSIDASGILNVMAVEERSNTKASIQIVPSYGLTKTEVDQMVRESVKHAREDMLEHRLIDLGNQIRQDIAAIEKSLTIVGDDIEVGYRAEMIAAIEKLRGLEGSKDAEAIHAALQEMDKKSTRLGEMAVTKLSENATLGDDLTPGSSCRIRMYSPLDKEKL